MRQGRGSLVSLGRGLCICLDVPLLPFQPRFRFGNEKREPRCLVLPGVVWLLLLLLLLLLAGIWQQNPLLSSVAEWLSDWSLPRVVWVLVAWYTCCK